MLAANSLEGRLRTFALLLGSGSPEDIERIWKELWDLSATRLLHHEAPHAVEKIVEAARKNAKDFFITKGGYQEIVGKVIDKAMGRAG